MKFVWIRLLLLNFGIKYKKELKPIKQENQNMKREIASLYGKIEDLDKDKERKNLIIQRLDLEQIPNKNFKEEVEHFIEKSLNVKIALNREEKIF
ncbi:hypothetical protein ILUMI_26766 [Ignelater luminosus]|uniref:Uncharacterized protein n=1 Tax=Ignelater luminosus TaxID=2038154 RepID=A0A8K0FYC9_IGNLU|nr:hypothetical protein ILUMI_26766 [Ignelater luminosus]